MHVADATFVVTDVETTGTDAESDRLLEIGAVKVRGGKIVDTFQQVVNPQRSVPSRITRMTGITTAMVFEAPPIEEVLSDYLDFLGEGVFVAHNRSFDERFLNAALKRASRDSLSNDVLCTLRLARRLLPGLESKGLSRLVQFYDVNVDGRHRALGDAEATSIVLRRLLRQLDFEHQIDTLAELLAFQYRPYQKVRETPRHLQRIREEVLPEVPEVPGVYTLTSSSGTPLYVGKAKRLSDRLRSHFTAVESRSGRKRKMLQKVRDVEWETTQTELQALLHESRRIKAEKPRYNRAQRRYYRRPFIRLDAAHTYPSISWSRTLADDRAEYYGPVRNADRAEIVIDVVGRFFSLRECADERLRQGSRCLYADMDRCVAPCETKNVERYAEVVDRVRTFLEGRGRTVIERLRDRMRQASDRHDFEKAAAFRDEIDVLEGMLGKQRMWGAPVRRRNAVLVHSEKAEADEAHLHFVRFGQFVGTVTCPLPLGEKGRPRIHTKCRAHFDPAEDRPTAYSKKEVSEIRLLSHWIYKNRGELEIIRWTPDRSVDEVATEICEGLSRTEAASKSV